MPDQTQATKPAIRHIKGDWMTIDGFHTSALSHKLEVEVVGNQMWDADYRAGPDPLRVDVDGNIQGWGSVMFSPDEGELVRIGVVAPPEATPDANA